MKILITGATGMLGSFLLTQLSNKGYNIKIYVRKNTIKEKNVETIIGSLENIYLLNNEIKNVDIIIHLACTMSNDKNKVIDIDISSMNYLLNKWKKHEAKFIYLSSQSVYGYPIYIPMDEQHPLKPVNWYGRGKLINEKLFEIIKGIKNNKNYTILRSPLIMAEHHKMYKTIVGELIINAINNNNFNFKYDKSKTINLSHGMSWIEISYFVDLICKIIEKDIKGVYNVSSGYFSWYELIKTIINISNSSSKIIFNTGESSNICFNYKWLLSTKKINEYLNIKQKHTLEEVIKKIYNIKPNNIKKISYIG